MDLDGWNAKSMKIYENATKRMKIHLAREPPKPTKSCKIMFFTIFYNILQYSVAFSYMLTGCCWDQARGPGPGYLLAWAKFWV